jgi:hypothetical protein
VKIEERSAGAALEQLDAAPVNRERALVVGRGYGVRHDGRVASHDGRNKRRARKGSSRIMRDFLS